MVSCRESILKRINIPSEGRLLLAFSGGEDSLFLLYALSVLAPERTTALYVNHNIRGEKELEREVELNTLNARRLGIPFDIAVIPPGVISALAEERNTGIEAAAREKRYSLLLSYAGKNGFDYILTAHHMDDQVETVLMRMMENSPFWKWGGIRERDGRIIRPILHIRKSEIREVVSSLSLEYSLDSTNSDTKYKRNYIRAAIMPGLRDSEKEIISSIAGNVSSLAVTPLSFEHASPLYVSFSRKDYLLSSQSVRETTLYSMFSCLGETERLSRRYLSEIDEAAVKGSTRVETKDYIVYVYGDTVKGVRKLPSDFSSPFLGEKTLLPPPLGVTLGKVDSLTLEIEDAILECSMIRPSRPGDTILLVDGRRKISSLLKEFKIPYALVLVYNGEITAFFSSFLGGRDRLSSSLRGRKGTKVAVTVGESRITE